jgi:probable phosphoglycerate mutase
MHLYFVRHGESQANVERVISNRDLPHPLTERGRLQARELAERLAGVGATALYASPIPRAVETAEILGDRLGLPVVRHAALREFDCGMVEGCGDAAAWAAHEEVIAAWASGQLSARIPDGESFEEMAARFVPFVADLQKNGTPQNVTSILVGHGSLFHHMLPLVLDNVDRDWIVQYPLRNCAVVHAVAQGEQLHCHSWDGQPLPV